MLDATRLRVLVAVARHGSVTAAAQALNYAQPSISHHIARLEAETGAKLMERAGRGVRLTEAGQLLAGRAEEILGRIDAAEAELAAHVGLRRDRVRVAAFGSALSTLVPAAGTALRAERPGTELLAVQAGHDDALRMLRAGEVDVALTFTYLRDGAAGAGTPGPPDSRGEDDARSQVVVEEPVYLITPAGPGAGPGVGRGGAGAGPAIPVDLADLANEKWIVGCERCQEFLTELCRSRGGFTPEIACLAGDYVAAQALVAAGAGVAMLPGLALRAARHPGIAATPLDGVSRRVHAVTYGAPPDPPASAWLVRALTRAATGQAPVPVPAQFSAPQATRSGTAR